MRSKTSVMIALAAVFGFIAILAGQRWLDRQSGQHLREVAWPADALPKSAFLAVGQTADERALKRQEYSVPVDARP
jgi:Flp pilus assembly protein CpaB